MSYCLIQNGFYLCNYVRYIFRKSYWFSDAYTTISSVPNTKEFMTVYVSMFVFMYVCMYACIYVCMYVCMYVYACMLYHS